MIFGFNSRSEYPLLVHYLSKVDAPSRRPQALIDSHAAASLTKSAEQINLGRKQF